MKFKIHWLDGKVEIVEGRDFPDAFRSAGLGAGAVKAVDYYEETEESIEHES